MANSTAQQLILENKKRHQDGKDAFALDLGNCGLTECPPELFDCTWLEELTLSSSWWDWQANAWRQSANAGPKNQLSTLPDEMDQLVRLKRLVLQKCWQTDLIYLDPLAGLSKLESLWLSHAYLFDLRPLSGLHHLQMLNVSYTGLWDLSPLAGCKRLTQLYASGIPFHDLAPLRDLPAVALLDVRNTHLKDLAPIGGWKKLEEMREGAKPVGGWQNIREIYASGTKVEDLTPLKNLKHLTNLDISHTAVQDLSPVAKLLQKDLNLFAENCPLVIPPAEIVNRGKEAIAVYFSDFGKKEAVHLSEIKCLIIGEGGAGKTSLARRLVNQEMPAESDLTRGINVDSLELTIFGDRRLQLNLWDFGGQEIYHATHQFFLTKKSLYVLVDDTRKDDKTVNDPLFNYWLQLAELCGGGSPLLIVQNEKGDHAKQIDLKGMQGRFTFVQEVRQTNLFSKRGIDDVKRAMESLVEKMPHIGDMLRQEWLDVRNKMEQLSKDPGKNFITVEEYLKVCDEFSVDTEKEAFVLSDYLHDIGAILHFRDHPLLERMVILNNRWVTNAVYKVLDSEIVRGKFGYFGDLDLAQLWQAPHYHPRHHDTLLALMERFELCYKLPDKPEDVWIAPQLLPAEQPPQIGWNQEDASLTIRYQYDFMPRGLLSRFIVRMHRYLLDPRLAWRSGVLLKRQNAEALVTETWGAREITVQVRGAQAKELLTLIAEEFDQMHGRFDNLRFKKLIPCNCQECKIAAKPNFYRYDDLLNRQERNHPTVECKNSYKAVSVASLIDGVFVEDMKSKLSASQVRDLVAQGETKMALDMLNDYRAGNDITLLKSRLSLAAREAYLNKISREVYLVEVQRINDAILDMLSQAQYRSSTVDGLA